MEIANHQKAEILARALPYIQMYRKKVIVVKYGGNAMINEELKETVMNDLVLLSTIGIHVVLVHGGVRRSTRPWSVCIWTPSLWMVCGLPIKRPQKWCKWYWPVR